MAETQFTPYIGLHEIAEIDSAIDKATEAIRGLVNIGNQKYVADFSQRQNVDTTFYVEAGQEYALSYTGIPNTQFNAYVPADPSTICKPTNANISYLFTPTVSGYVRIFDHNSCAQPNVEFTLVSNLAKKVDSSIKFTAYIETAEQSTAYINNNYNNMARGGVYVIGSSSISINNAPRTGFVGTVLNFGSPYMSGGQVQMAFTLSGENVYNRCKKGSTWSSWRQIQLNKKVYYVGGSSSNQSISALFDDLKNDFNEKIIFINSGEYDIFQEYRDLEVPSPPDNVSASDYLDRCIFVPPNTTLIGLGNVTLKWLPQKANITYGEARTWSPLNVKYPCHIENIEIRCKYSRYAIHDDSHNAQNDRQAEHTYENVRCVYEFSEDGYGFNSIIGFGLSQENVISFKNCRFEAVNSDSRVCPFYVHTSDHTIEKSPTLNVENCVLIGGGGENRATVRLQATNETAERVVTNFSNCHISNNVHLVLYNEDCVQPYDVTLLRCGNPTVTVDDSEHNNYPVRVYQ